MKIDKFEEKIVLFKLKNNDRQAFIKAYDLYVDNIYRFIYFKVGDKEEAEDLTSAVFLKTWNYLQYNSLKDFKTLKALFYKTARNIIIDHYRKVNRHEEIKIENPDNLELIDDRQDIVHQAELTSDLIIVESKLPELKDEYREIIILRFINEFTIKEISEILEKPRSNVRVLIYRALNSLRELMNQQN